MHIVTIANAQDPKERAYFYLVLIRQHKDKQKVTGWTQQRIEEKLNRDMLAVFDKAGKVYLGWRLQPQQSQLDGHGFPGRQNTISACNPGHL